MPATVLSHSPSVTLRSRAGLVMVGMDGGAHGARSETGPWVGAPCSSGSSWGMVIDLSKVWAARPVRGPHHREQGCLGVVYRPVTTEARRALRS